MPQGRWTASELPDLAGRTVVITGANSGIGYEAAAELARKRAAVVLACRSLDKARVAADRIEALARGAKVEVMELDLARLASVRAFADRFRGAHRELHVLINNAGVMALPYRKTADGFEMQFGTNHLGHFALTGLLLDVLLATAGARVVTVSSTAHWFGSIRFDDLQLERGYGKWSAYGQSKLANLLFAYELQRRADAAGAKLTSVGCHPGYCATELQAAGPRMEGSTFMGALMEFGNRLFAQSAAMGALSPLYAATAPDVKGGDFIVPDGFTQNRGYPTKAKSNARSHDAEVAKRLWEVSEKLTGVRYDALASRPR